MNQILILQVRVGDNFIQNCKFLTQIWLDVDLSKTWGCLYSNGGKYWYYKEIWVWSLENKITNQAFIQILSEI